MLVYRHNKLDDYEIVDLMLVTRIEVAAHNGARKPSK